MKIHDDNEVAPRPVRVGINNQSRPGTAQDRITHQAFYEILIQQLLQLQMISFKSTQIYDIVTYRHVKIKMDDDTQKEQMIIPSFEGVEDVLVGRSHGFQLLDTKGSILVDKGVESCCLNSKRINP